MSQNLVFGSSSISENILLKISLIELQKMDYELSSKIIPETYKLPNFTRPYLMSSDYYLLVYIRDLLFILCTPHSNPGSFPQSIF